MSIVVTIANEAKLRQVRNLLGAKTEDETVELALDRIIEEFNLREESEEEIDIDVHTLNRIPPKRTYEIEAEFEIVGRGMPMKYDLSDYDFSEYENEE